MNYPDIKDVMWEHYDSDLEPHIRAKKVLVEYEKAIKPQVESLEKKLADAESELAANKLDIETLNKLVVELREENKRLRKQSYDMMREANNALYFEDSSDYCVALWEILYTVKPDLRNNDSIKLEYIDQDEAISGEKGA